jgi:hypothetical protein
MKRFVKSVLLAGLLLLAGGLRPLFAAESDVDMYIFGSGMRLTVCASEYDALREAERMLGDEHADGRGTGNCTLAILTDVTTFSVIEHFDTEDGGTLVVGSTMFTGESTVYGIISVN